MAKITGADKFELRLGHIAKDAPEAVWKVLKDGGKRVINTGNKLMAESPRSGRVYKRGAIIHKASGPGEPPAIDTGRLVASAKTINDETDKIVYASWSTEYALALEVGTSTMAERPFAAPALAIEKPGIIRRAQEAVAGAVRKT